MPNYRRASARRSWPTEDGMADEATTTTLSFSSSRSRARFAWSREETSSGFVAFVVPFGSTSRVARTGGPLTHGRRASLREEVRVPGVTRLYCGLRLRAEP